MPSSLQTLVPRDLPRGISTYKPNPPRQRTSVVSRFACSPAPPQPARLGSSGRGSSRCTLATTTTGRSPRGRCRWSSSNLTDLSRLDDGPVGGGGTNTPSRATRALPVADRQAGSATPFGEDACCPPTRPIRIGGQRRRAHSYLIPEALSAHPGRPPSRRRSRPRAAGTSGSTATPKTGASHVASGFPNAMKRTCVRTVGTPSDGHHANTRTYCSFRDLGRSKMARLCGIGTPRACKESCIVPCVGCSADGYTEGAGRFSAASLELLFRDGC
jgi:hypothetical protein